MMLKSYIILFIVLIVDITASILWFGAVVKEEYNWPRRKADVGVVFMSNFTRNFKDIGPETLRRVIHATNLYHQGLTDHIFCVGGTRRTKNVFGAEYMKQNLLNRGVPGERILIEKISNDSQSNWQVAYPIIRAHQWHSIMIISSPLHIHRLKRLLFNKPWQGLDIYFYPYSYKTAQPQITLFEIWRQVHYEWLAYLSHYCLPESWYHYFIEKDRQ